MSDVVIFENGGLFPDYLRTTELDASTKSLMGIMRRRISIESGVFRMMVNGQEMAKIDDRHLNVVILANSATNSRTYYGKEKYVKGVKAKPVCWSEDTVTPSAKSSEPQSSHCATCPQNIKGSGDRPDSRACRYNRRIAVMLEHDIGGDIYAMSLPSASIFGEDPQKMGFQQYGKFIAGFQANVNSVVTKMRFDTDASAPKLVFSPFRALTPPEYASVCAKVDHPDAIAAITMNVADIDSAEPTAGEVAQPSAVETPKPVAPVVAKPVPQAVKPVVKPVPPVVKPVVKPPVQVVEEVVPEPTVRQTATVHDLVADTPASTPAGVASILDEWSDDE